MFRAEGMGSLIFEPQTRFFRFSRTQKGDHLGFFSHIQVVVAKYQKNRSQDPLETLENFRKKSLSADKN